MRHQCDGRTDYFFVVNFPLLYVLTDWNILSQKDEIMDDWTAFEDRGRILHQRPLNLTTGHHRCHHRASWKHDFFPPPLSTKSVHRNCFRKCVPPLSPPSPVETWFFSTTVVHRNCPQKLFQKLCTSASPFIDWFPCGDKSYSYNSFDSWLELMLCWSKVLWCFWLIPNPTFLTSRGFGRLSGISPDIPQQIFVGQYSSQIQRQIYSFRSFL